MITPKTPFTRVVATKRNPPLRPNAPHREYYIDIYTHFGSSLALPHGRKRIEFEGLQDTLDYLETYYNSHDNIEILMYFDNDGNQLTAPIERRRPEGTTP